MNNTETQFRQEMHKNLDIIIDKLFELKDFDFDKIYDLELHKFEVDKNEVSITTILTREIMPYDNYYVEQFLKIIKRDDGSEDIVIDFQIKLF